MNPAFLQRETENTWRLDPRGGMRVPAVLFASEALIEDMDDKVLEQIANVASLPGIVHAAYAMPDAHSGYGFPIGGVAAFDAERGGVVSAGGVGFDISCGVRTLRTGLSRDEVIAVQKRLADELYRSVPAGVGAKGALKIKESDLDPLMTGGARWAVERGFGSARDLERIEERGCVGGADPRSVSREARQRQLEQVGTLGSGNHYLEVQEVVEVFHADAAKAFGMAPGDVVVSIHCGSRGLGHQIGTDYLKSMAVDGARRSWTPLDRQLACAPIESELGQGYLGAMRAAINCALANRHVIAHFAEQSIAKILPRAEFSLIYDVSHNTCKEEEHEVGGERRRLYVHRKGATRAFGPGHPELPADLRPVGQPVFIGGSMGTASYILAGTESGMKIAFGSACHGAGRRMSRSEASKRWQGRQVVAELKENGILVRSPSLRGVAEEAPGAYKDVHAVALAAEAAGLAQRVARLRPMVCIKG